MLDHEISEGAPINFESVSKYYLVNGQRRMVVDGVDLECPGGKITTIVGPSGCGKTTLLNFAAGLIRPDTGQVRVGPDVVQGPGPDRGVVFQQYALFPWLTVAENIGFAIPPGRMLPQERQETINAYLNLVGLWEHRHALPKALSGGMKQRCALARALAAEPRVLLLDEPFGALDAITRHRLQYELLEIFARRRQTLLFITHDFEEAAFLSHRIVVMCANPARIVSVIDLPYGFPRTEDTRSDPAFLEVRKWLWEQLKG
ncbi:ABC transporter ATP-binding protein [Bradyrhizobium guangzhouense]|uniref:ABC transporter ATP-binding protein n=1 Tax=Bradyrhizobium guangzhouense TaxID=1325095 RepID=UPI0010098793|nr:ABC transporter ATP-binding protein [Bradyrhizobium guangzhouense]RXH11390.1 ABC transporter ATP-binding protein [Bradyrhizobium guangzhouense]